MTGRSERPSGAAGGPPGHVPVLLAEVLRALAPERGGVIVDGTFGAGGYSQALLAAEPDLRVIGIDRDPTAIAAGADLVRRYGGRLTLAEGRFGDLAAIAADAGFAAVSGVVLDVGVSSMQIDEAGRGFSFRHDGPLDMRMEKAGRSAADLVNEASEEELADIFHSYGEERRARAVARAIAERRRRAPFATTGDLAALVAAHVRGEPGGIHPATRVFQALRIAVNDELGELVMALHAAERIIAPGGRLVVVTFHSLEDRIVKQFMTARMGRAPAASRHAPAQDVAEPTFAALQRGPVLPSEAETAGNPRARSAKLRAGLRTDAPPQPPLAHLAALAELPDRSERRRSAR